MKTAKYECSLFGFVVLAAMCPADEFNAWVAKKFKTDELVPPHSYAATFYLSEKNIGHPIVVWMSPDAGGGCLAHECYHAAKRILARRGIDVGDAGDPSGEVMAYLLGDMFKALCNGLWHGKMGARK